MPYFQSVGSEADPVSFMRGLFAGKVISPRWFQEMFGSRATVSFPGTRMRETGAGLFQSSYGDALSTATRAVSRAMSASCSTIRTAA